LPDFNNGASARRFQFQARTRSTFNPTLPSAEGPNQRQDLPCVDGVRYSLELRIGLKQVEALLCNS
jgi:hypothetical protein